MFFNQGPNRKGDSADGTKNTFFNPGFKGGNDSSDGTNQMLFNPGSKGRGDSADNMDDQFFNARTRDEETKNNSNDSKIIMKFKDKDKNKVVSSAVVDEETEGDQMETTKKAMVKIKEIELKTENFVSKEFTRSASKLTSVLPKIKKSGSLSMKKLVELVIEQKLLQYYCKACELILKEANPDSYTGIDKSHIKPFDDMAIFLVYMTDSSSDASEIISEMSEFLKEIIYTLQNWYKNVSSKKMEMDIYWLETLISLLHNVSMYDDNLQRMRSLKTIEAVQLFLDFNNDTIRLLSLATMADLVNESESKMICSGGDVIRFLMATVSNALDAESRAYDGWSLVELTRIVHQVARNDSNKRTVVKHGAIPLLIQICQSNNVEEQAAAVNAIWRLSFDHENKKEMLQKTEWKVVDVLNSLSKSSDKRVKRASNKALWTINDHKERSTEEKRSIDTDHHIMISYNWGHQSTAKQICDHLKNTGLQVWMDVDNMHGSTIQAMASAVEQAYIVLVCYSYKYKNSDNCRSEAEYAYQLKKKIVPVKMEKDYKADGWLGFIIGAKLFYDFSGKYPFENKIKELTREVSNHQTPAKDPADVIMPIVETSATASSSPPVRHHSDWIGKIRKWSESHVEKWLTKHDLPKEKLGSLRGKDVAFLCLILQESPDNFYRLLRKQFHIKDVTNIANLRFALYDLARKHSE